MRRTMTALAIALIATSANAETIEQRIVPCLGAADLAHYIARMR